ncbi:hypothetical protein [Thermogemmatispora sp.]|uniref:hypothetical protein n=1 Tax=Thermogemmatispora sp. TaxID=1968838 RepID=UPI0035E401D5
MNKLSDCQQRQVSWLKIVALLILLLLLSACGEEAARGPGGGGQMAQGSAPPTLYVLDGLPSSGSQRLLVFQPSSGGSINARIFPAGLLGSDRRHLYRALSQGGETTIEVTDLSTGTRLPSLVIPGSYATTDAGTGKSMLSGDGRWLALRDLKTPTGMTHIVLIDTRAAKVVKTIDLKGDFDLDAIAPEGNALYLLEYLDRAAYRYNVRVYDLAAGQLVPGAIVDKNEPDEKMQGLALTRQLSLDGEVAFTLYINPQTNKAFIHVLPLTYRTGVPLVARCLDLPTGTGPQASALLHFYILFLGRDTQTVYAVNAALGVAALISLAPMAQGGVTALREPWTTSFHPSLPRLPADAAAMQRQLANGAVASLQQTRLYVVGLRGIWVFSLPGLELLTVYLPQSVFTGLELEIGQGRLYAVGPTEGIIPIDSASGMAERPLPVPARAPWGIGWLGASQP